MSRGKGISWARFCYVVLATATAGSLVVSVTNRPLNWPIYFVYAADKYQIKGLRYFCEQNLISKLNVQDVAHYLVLAHLQSAPQLLEASLKFLEEHKKEIVDRAEWKQLNKNYPDLFYLATNQL